MRTLNQILNKIDSEDELTKDNFKFLLQLKNRGDIDLLFRKAYEIKQKYVGNKTYFRGIVELSNICRKDCYYCGIRRSNKNVNRFVLKEEQILSAAKWAYENNYGSVVLQSGERNDKAFIEFIEKTLIEIKKLSDGELGITISFGEQSYDTYKRWFEAGAHRYLLRIETSNPEHYKKLHPPDHFFEERLNCLKMIKDIGYQTGTGVMIGLPFQTVDDLVSDLFFFKEFDIDMLGMGPYLVNEDTPLAKEFLNFEEKKDEQYLLGLKMIACARILLRDVNIASTTALQALKYSGREMGLLAGANIIMPNITPMEYREAYQLYDNKPCIDDDAELCLDCLKQRIYGIESEIGYGEWGDSPHFKKKNLINNI
ncbi:MAG: [FeFe] hydrogenase H-cluster radical SAM maturase HydE [Melioribacteraceae bacterium]|nr:[FeFe] hydrogenase H-cluster radical SAM maturase HydE [Melioribacteraceae bacterium]